MVNKSFSLFLFVLLHLRLVTSLTVIESSSDIGIVTKESVMFNRNNNNNNNTNLMKRSPHVSLLRWAFYNSAARSHKQMISRKCLIHWLIIGFALFVIYDSLFSVLSNASLLRKRAFRKRSVSRILSYQS